MPRSECELIRFESVVRAVDSNAVENFFSVFTRKRIRRGTFHSLVDLQAAIKRYLAEMLTAGVAIAKNTSSIPALKDTIAVGSGMVETAGRLKDKSATIAKVLAARAQAGAA